MDENQRDTNHGKTWPDGWTAQDLADYMNRKFELAGMKTRVRVRPDNEPLPTFPPGSSITDVLKRQAKRDKPDRHQAI